MWNFCRYGSAISSYEGKIVKSVVFFNNKGGVGKTTLACNVASDLATRKRLRVLLVDCDPQCNSTQLILSTDVWSSIYWDGETADAVSQKTLIDVLKPIERGDAGIEIGIEPARSSNNRFGVDLIPGHPRMSVIEDLLSRAWGETAGGDIGGLRRTNWVSSLVREYDQRYDVVVFDVGPSLGSLNRTVLIGGDHFVTPMGADIFSIVGVRNIAEWIINWQSVYSTGLNLCEGKFPGAMSDYGFGGSDSSTASFIGYTVQQYITKSKKGVRRPTQAFEKILRDIPEEIETSLGKFTSKALSADAMKLGDVPNMYSLIPLAQSVNSPIAQLQASDGLAGGQYQQQQNYVRTIRAVSEALQANLGLS